MVIMHRTAAIIVLLVGLAASQFCPDFTECTSCELGWQQPVFVENGVLTGPDSCTVTLTWNYPFTAEDDRTNPRLVFLCAYDNAASCDQGEEDVCASCQELVIEGVQPSRTPHITYSDTCGNVDTFPIAQNCQTADPTTTEGSDITTAGNGPTTTEGSDITTADNGDTTTEGSDITTADAGETTTSSGLTCRRSFDLIGNRCLLVDPFLVANWQEARYFCQELGADLVMINDDDLFLSILEYIKENNLENVDYWIGATDKLVDGTFTWLNGVAMQYGTPYWAAYGLGNNNYIQEPSNQGILNYDCIQMDAGRFLYYDDDDCDFQKAAICEHD